MRVFCRLLLVPVSVLAVVLADTVWPRLLGLASMVTLWPPLVRLRDRVGRLPTAAALLLFVIPEACSRSGWVISAWLVLHGEPWRALACYVGTKLLAVTLALWVCSASLPVLLRVKLFEQIHGRALRQRQAASDWVHRNGGWLLAEEMARRRRAASGELSRRSSALDPGPATPSAPASRSRRG